MVVAVGLRGALGIFLTGVVLFEWLGFSTFSTCMENGGSFISCAVVAYFAGLLKATFYFYAFILVALFDGLSHVFGSKTPTVSKQEIAPQQQVFRVESPTPSKQERSGHPQVVRVPDPGARPVDGPKGPILSKQELPAPQQVSRVQDSGSRAPDGSPARSMTVNTTNLNLRSCADLTCGVVATMPQGLRVKVVGAEPSGWLQVQMNNPAGQTITGFANARFLTQD